MDKPGLSLVPIDDLLREAESRCISFVAAYFHIEDDKKESKFWYGQGNWHDACGLTNCLNNDVLNNWNGEINTLQKLNAENTEEDGG